MKTRLRFLCALLVLTLTAPADDRTGLVGVWRGSLPKDPDGSIELTITPTKISGRDARSGKSLGEGAYQLDATAKTLDATKLELSGRGKAYRGIYQLNGNTLLWCATSRKDRPSQLEHRPWHDQFLMTLQRQR